MSILTPAQRTLLRNAANPAYDHHEANVRPIVYLTTPDQSSACLLCFSVFSLENEAYFGLISTKHSPPALCIITFDEHGRPAGWGEDTVNDTAFTPITSIEVYYRVARDRKTIIVHASDIILAMRDT